jgi:GMP synthase (glutamine-hydrolysing)
MPEARWLVVQHQDDCPPGVLAAWAAARGVTLQLARPDRDEPLPDAARFDAVCVLGSDRSVNDATGWIVAEAAWMREVVVQTPVLGICFGAQALTVALDGAVGRELPEIDWLTLDLEPDAGFPAGPWLCWHNDFITPPAGVRVLARSARAVHAFAQGQHLAVQFHPEVTAEIVGDWMRAEELGRDLARAGVDLDALRAKSERLAPGAGAAAWKLFDAFAAGVATHAP